MEIVIDISIVVGIALGYAFVAGGVWTYIKFRGWGDGEFGPAICAFWPLAGAVLVGFIPFWWASRAGSKLLEHLVKSSPNLPKAQVKKEGLK